MSDDIQEVAITLRARYRGGHSTVDSLVGQVAAVLMDDSVVDGGVSYTDAPDDETYESLPTCYGGRHDFTATDAEWQTTGVTLSCICGQHSLTTNGDPLAARIAQ